MSDHHIALTGVLSQSGLTPEEQRELLLQLVQGLERAPVGRLPDAPDDYVARAKDLLLSVFLPQFGPLNISQPHGAVGSYTAEQGLEFGFARTPP